MLLLTFAVSRPSTLGRFMLNVDSDACFELALAQWHIGPNTVSLPYSKANLDKLAVQTCWRSACERWRPRLRVRRSASRTPT